MRIEVVPRSVEHRLREPEGGEREEKLREQRETIKRAEAEKKASQD